VTAVALGLSDPYLEDLLQSAISQIANLRLVASVRTERQLLETMSGYDPEVVVIDDRFEGGLENLVWSLSIRRPVCSVLVLLHAHDELRERRLGDLGARSMVLPAPPEDIAVRIQAAGLWATQLRGATMTAGPSARARVVAFAGAKGGVGTTLIACHLALAAAVSRPDLQVCLVDLDIDKGDVPELLGISSRVTLADLARVADGNLSATTVGDALTIHDSGLHVLLAPAEIREVEAVTTAAVTEILQVLREQYDVVVVDVGSHVTTVQAAAVSMADEVFVVATPDLLCLRGLKRVLRAWESVDVCEEGDVRILLNRTSRKNAVPIGDVARLVPAAKVEPVTIPAGFRRLEEAVNDRDPSLVRGKPWARAILSLTRSALLGSPGPNGTPQPRVVAAVGRKRAQGDAGSITLENVALFPKLLLVALLCWQATLFALSFVWSSYAADAASRAGARGGDAQQAAEGAVPGGFVNDVHVSTGSDAGGTTITVTLAVPLVFPGLDTPMHVDSTRHVVEEPQ
jgi:pilus assembly protein CpaE